MKQYILCNRADGLKLFDKNGKLMRLKDLLDLHPEQRVYALRGQMGAGKTTFVKALCEEMGVKDVVNSPTFAIVNVYEYTNAQSKEEIYHFDCYRLKDIQEALDLGAEEYLYSGNYCFIEWPEMIEDILPANTIELQIQVQDDGQRLILVQ